jgi:acetyl/propionyl-CoA carboxylase alpha subunit
MKRAIQEYIITGIQTTLPFGEFVMSHPNFISGDIDTHFIQNFYHPESEFESITEEELALLAPGVAFLFEQTKSQLRNSEGEQNNHVEHSAWQANRRSSR